MSSTLQHPCPSFLRGLGVSFFPFFLHNTLMNVLQQIFKEHYEEMLYILHPRYSVIQNVDKMIKMVSMFMLRAILVTLLLS
ncbi:MAG TPA: hypothetical protein DIT54_03180 [Lachnospiraceae bacterium]|nr:hypothetical protein [Lachnospiraceae bacterium]